MSRLDDELRQALRPAAPSDGFAERVLARAAARQPNAVRRPGLRWVAAAAAILALFVVWLDREHDRKVATESAKEQVVLALRITAEKLQLVREKVQQVNQ